GLKPLTDKEVEITVKVIKDPVEEEAEKSEISFNMRPVEKKL
ncbi:unnamed protein product, partial [marine sediment metagenome]